MDLISSTSKIISSPKLKIPKMEMAAEDMMSRMWTKFKKQFIV
jgi:hypothetical protein